jgi:hypothetical protein
MASASGRALTFVAPPVADRGRGIRSLRGRKHGAAAVASAIGDRAATMRSDDGMVSFAVRHTGARLFIERTHRNRMGTMAVQCLLISGREEFEHWCELEPTRFEHPVLFVRLWRYGDEVFNVGE